MKKLLFSLFLLPFTLAAQSLQVAFADSVVYGNAYNTSDMASYVNITNTSGSSLDVKVKRLNPNPTALTDSNAICWGVCFQTNVSESPNSITIKAGQTTDNSGFIGHVYPDQDGIEQGGDITYVFFDANNINDSVAVTVHYELQKTFSTPEAPAANQVRVFPNPASDRLSVNFDLRQGRHNSFELFSLVGKKVYHKNLSQGSGEFNLDLSKLSRGIYFYVLRTDGEASLTRKLVVK